MKDSQLWYTQPAAGWTEALPLGNGQLGAMVYGRTGDEWMDITESTCWSGCPEEDNSQPGAPEVVRQMRQALTRHDYERSESLAHGITGRKGNFGTHLPAFRLNIQNDATGGASPEEYTRSLRLEDAVCRTGWKEENGKWQRETWISNPHQVLVSVLETDFQGTHATRISVESAGCPLEVQVESGRLIVRGQALEDMHSDGRTGVRFVAVLTLQCGEAQANGDGDGLIVHGHGSVLVRMTFSTDFSGQDPEAEAQNRMTQVAALPPEVLREAHVREYQALEKRAYLETGDAEAGSRPVDERLRRIREGHPDPSLMALMFRYGRYLIISASRPDSPLPAHLQGIWNDGIACRMGWTCDMHLDINTQMNYWPAEVTGLGDCHQPLFTWLRERVMPSGQRTARETYGLEGWTAHVVSNAWGYSAPGWGTTWGIHPTGGLWAALHLWDHFSFTGDSVFLETQLLPLYREAVVFFLGYLTEDPDTGCLLSGPSMSPENGFIHNWKTGVPASSSMGTVCDTVMIRKLFSAWSEACARLDIQDSLLENVRRALEKLPLHQVGRHGQLQEWFYDYEEPDPHHRHMSHMLAVYPFGEIDPETTPDLAEAAGVTLRRRMTPDWCWEDTGWARALVACQTARLRQGEETFRHLHDFQRLLTNPNLLSFCPPGAGADCNVFEMDGTTGFCAAVAELLLQSHGKTLMILPALPQAWPEGRVEGLHARGGTVVGIVWSENRATEVSIYALRQQTVTLRLDHCDLPLTLAAGETQRLQRRDNDWVTV